MREEEVVRQSSSWTASPSIRVRVWTCSHFKKKNETVPCRKRENLIQKLNEIAKLNELENHIY